MVNVSPFMNEPTAVAFTEIVVAPAGLIAATFSCPASGCGSWKMFGSRVRPVAGKAAIPALADIGAVAVSDTLNGVVWVSDAATPLRLAHRRSLPSGVAVN